MSTQPGLFDQPDAHQNRNGEAETARPAVATAGSCPVCGEPFQRTKVNRTHCSEKCKWADWNRRNPRPKHQTEARKKATGQARAADAHAWELQVCRRIAREIAQATGTADIERVRERVEDMGLELAWGNWTGGVFKSEEWEPTGQYVEVRHKGGQCRGGGVRVWRLRG